MSNVAGKAYGMNVLTPMKPWRTWINVVLFMVSRLVPGTLKGLLGLSIIHFARWVMIRRAQWPPLDGRRPELRNDYMLFVSNFNGTWDQYIDAFSDGIPNGLNLFWYASTKFPQSIPITPFKTYIRFNQIHTDYYYNATPGSAQRDVKSALRVAAGLRALATDLERQDATAFAASLRAFLLHEQNDLGAPGLAPIASEDTENAERNRTAAIVKERERRQAAQHELVQRRMAR
jgi:hypothetical protein